MDAHHVSDSTAIRCDSRPRRNHFVHLTLILPGVQRRALHHRAHANVGHGSFVVNVVDTTAPHIDAVRATPDILAPPNHKLVPVTISVQAFDTIDPMPHCAVFDVTANEPIIGPFSGNPNFDWRITGELELRAERTGEGDGRIYSVHVSCSDFHGNESASSVTVTVPKGGSDQEAVVVPTPGRRRAAGKP
jgi:hypothetical protein